MLAVDRLSQIEGLFSAQVARIVVIELDEELLRLVLYFEDGSNLRIAEQWNGEALSRYSYYWLTGENELKTGWVCGRRSEREFDAGHAGGIDGHPAIPSLM